MKYILYLVEKKFKYQTLEIDVDPEENCGVGGFDELDSAEKEVRWS